MAANYNEARRPDEWRIVLTGKTGAGKSSVGNTILGREAFYAELSATSVTSTCKKERGVVWGKGVAVIDTPGLFGTTLSNEQVLRKIKLCIRLSSPGPHAFLVVVQLGRFTEEEKQTVKMIQQAFGEDAADYTMLLFTHGDKLKKKSIEDFLSESLDLEELVHKCNGRYHVFNESNNPSQIIELLEKIKLMIEANGGSHYTTEMYQKAEEEIEKEKQQILKESEAEKNKALEELTAKFTGQMLEMKIEMLNMRLEDEARAKAEASNWAAALARSEANAEAFTKALAKTEDKAQANAEALNEALAKSEARAKALTEALKWQQQNSCVIS